MPKVYPDKATRYRAQAEQYRREAHLMDQGLLRSDKLAFADQWERLADAIDGRTKADPTKRAVNDP